MTNFWYGPSPAQWQACLQHIRSLEQQLERLRQQLDSLNGEIDELKKRTPIHVEYHFDQLKVSRLEGTLNIGLSPQGMQPPESFEVPAPGMWKAADGGQQDDDADRVRALQREAAAFMENEAPALLVRMTEASGTPLDEAHRNLILKDIKSQLNARVHYYAKTVSYPADGAEEERQIWGNTVMEKTKRDVEKAIAAYLNGLKKTPETKEGDRT